MPVVCAIVDSINLQNLDASVILKDPSGKVLFLPLANQVWGKVMFLLACVILFTRGLCMMSLPVWLTSPMFFLWGGGGLCLGKPLPDRDPPLRQRAGGTHPTGMLSCVNFLALSGRLSYYILPHGLNTTSNKIIIESYTFCFK